MIGVFVEENELIGKKKTGSGVVGRREQCRSSWATIWYASAVTNASFPSRFWTRLLALGSCTCCWQWCCRVSVAGLLPEAQLLHYGTYFVKRR